MSRENVYVQKLEICKKLPLNSIILNESLFIKHSFALFNSQAELILGSLHLMVLIKPGPEKDVLAVSTNIMEQLNLPDSSKLNVSITGNKIRLGPILGVFVKENTLLSLNRRQYFSKINNLCGDEGIILSYFFYKEVDLQKMRINSFIYNFSKRSWEKRLLPIPDVIYNRGIASFPPNQRARIEHLLSIFGKLGVKKINSRHFFDKWETYIELKKTLHIASHLPETVSYQSIKDLDYMTAKYNILFAKGCRGNNGREVIKIVSNDEGFVYSYYTANNLIKGKVAGLMELEKRLFYLFGKKGFILQEGIDVINYEGNAADIRALLQKDIDNNWNITNIALRIAANHIPVTSTAAGSDVYRLEEGLQKCGLNNTQITHIKQDCRLFLNLFLNALESMFGPFGETGVDLAVDKKHKIWFLECNANPAKTVAMRSGNKEEKHLAVLYPLLYTKYLAGF